MTGPRIIDVEQGTPEWHDARRGIMTASVVGKFITAKTIKPASNDTSRSMTAQLVAERITGWTEDTYVSAAMERGSFDEPYARDEYSKHYAPVTECGFMVRDDWGFTIGFSPDGLVGDEGLIEIKSREPKIQLATILDDEVPLENMAQIQCGLLVSGREWCDYVSFRGGMPLYVKRVHPSLTWRSTILDTVAAFEKSAAEMIGRYQSAAAHLPMTERVQAFEEMRI
jgi:hypothetical protein